MRKAVILMSILLCWVYSVMSQTAVQPSGSGTQGDPYVISTLEHLYWITQNNGSWDKYFIQADDINAAATSGWDSNSGFTPIGTLANKFTGSYDGQGYIIDSLYIDRGSTEYVGLFGYALGGTIMNVGVTNAMISGNNYVGGIAGNANTGSLIEKCYTTGYVSGYRCGGLVGYLNDNSTASLCYSKVIVSGTGRMGGLIGQVQTSSAVSNCYSRDSVSSSGTYCGGLVGLNLNLSVIENSYSTGYVNGQAGTQGGVSGYNSATFNNTFWDTVTSGIMTSEGGTPQNTTNMKTEATFTGSGWDFIGESANGTNDYWKIDVAKNDGYPYLTWEDSTRAKVTTQAVTDITDSSATGNGNITDLGISNPTQHGICWDTASSPDTSNYKTEEGAAGATGPFTSALTDLSSGTTYYVRAYAINPAGISYGKEYSFTTLKMAQTISFGALTAKTYGDDDFELTATASSGLAVTYSSSNSNVASITGSTVQIKGAGSATITASQAGDDVYEAADDVMQDLTVGKAELTVTAGDTLKASGEENPEFVLTYSGWKNDDNVDSIDVLPVASCSADAQSSPGEYTIEVSGGEDNNYEFSYVSGTLTVNGDVSISPASVKHMKVYPTATSGTLTIVPESSDHIEYSITDINGKLVEKGITTGNLVDVSYLEKGIYFLKIESQVFKFIKTEK